MKPEKAAKEAARFTEIFTPDVTDLNRVTLNGSGTETPIFDILAERYTITKSVPERQAALQIAGYNVAHAGNIIGITGQMKSGKSAALAAIAKAALSDGDFLGFSCPMRGNVIYIDTEQSPIDTKERIYLNIVRDINGGQDDVNELFTFNLRGRALAEMMLITEAIFNHAAPCIAVIDGLADYVTSVNDEAQSTAVIAKFLHLSALYNCLIILALHDNHNTEKSRGHLGSELDRKSEAVIRLAKDKQSGVITASGKFYRSIGNVPDIQFSWQDEAKGFEFLGYVDASGKASANELQKGRETLAGINFGKGLTYTELKQRIAERLGLSVETGRKKIGVWVGLGLIENRNNLYFAKDDEPPF